MSASDFMARRNLLVKRWRREMVWVKRVLGMCCSLRSCALKPREVDLACRAPVLAAFMIPGPPPVRMA